MWHQETLPVRTTSRTELVEITQDVARVVIASGLRDGICSIYSTHTTGGITIQENADPDVVRDMLMEINKIVPFEDGYHHRSGNAAAHIKTAFIGPSETVPLANGQLQLGRWQGIFFCEWDGPRQRQVLVSLFGQAPGAA